MKTSARCAAAFLSSIALSGCYSMQVTRSGSASDHPPTDWKSVQIYRSESAAPPHETLGEILLKGEAELLRSDDTQAAFFQHKAAELGANGIILLYGPQPGAAARAVSKIVPGLVYRESHALAIYVKDPPP